MFVKKSGYLGACKVPILDAPVKTRQPNSRNIHEIDLSRHTICTRLGYGSYEGSSALKQRRCQSHLSVGRARVKKTRNLFECTEDAGGKQIMYNGVDG